jgi:hypothetical protein
MGPGADRDQAAPPLPARPRGLALLRHPPDILVTITRAASRWDPTTEQDRASPSPPSPSCSYCWAITPSLRRADHATPPALSCLAVPASPVPLRLLKSGCVRSSPQQVSSKTEPPQCPLSIPPLNALLRTLNYKEFGLYGASGHHGCCPSFLHVTPLRPWSSSVFSL